MSEFAFAEWPQAWLDERVAHLLEHQQLPHSPERSDQIKRELAHLAFEIDSRELPLVLVPKPQKQRRR